MIRRAEPSAPFALTGRLVLCGFVAFFSLIAIVNSGLVYLAIRSWSGAETTSAYRAGQLFNAEFAEARAQAALGWRLSIGVKRAADGAAHIEILALDRDGTPLTGRSARATFQRPTDKRRDRAVDLRETGEGRYEADEPSLIPGRWNIVVDIIERGERRFRRVQRHVLL